MIKEFYELLKPGIVWGNALTALAGFLFAADGNPNLLTLLAMLAGLSLIVGASAAANNVLDSDIDAKMERTKSRALPSGRIGKTNALIYAGAVGLLGCTLLYVWTNLLTLGVALVGAFVYIALYTPLKRVSEHATLVGAIAGAIPPVVGYAAVTGTLDTLALLLFFVLVAWQMVHFFAIALYRQDEYSAAGVPVFPLRHGVFRTQVLMTVYVGVFAEGLYALALLAKLPLWAEGVLAVISVGWLILALTGFWRAGAKRWARVMFFYSLFALLIVSLVLVVR